MYRGITSFALLTLLMASTTALAWLDPTDPDVEVILDTADNQFQWYSGPGGQDEWLKNRGASTMIRMKGWQDISGFKFDLSAYRGQTVLEAEMHVAKADSYPIRSLVAATINGD